MVIKKLESSAVVDLEPLIATFPFKAYRNYRILSRQAQERVLRAELEATLRGQDAAAFVAAESERHAAVVCRRLPWDSDFFALPMGRVDLLNSGTTDQDVMDAATSACLDGCVEAGIRHLTARVDVADTVAISTLEKHGFRLMDALVTYVYHPRREPPPAVKEMGVLRAFRPEDTDQIIDITREAYRGFRGRFHLDPNLPDDRCDELYVEWARRCCDKQMADQVLVTENGRGDVHGFLSFRLLEPVSSVGGVPVYGGGLGACRRDRPGAYAGLIRAGTAWVHELGGVAECQTQNYNFSTVRVYEAVGAQYVRADYTFHAWLSPGGRR